MNSKLPNSGTSIFAVMSAMAKENNAINLSQGFPDFNCPDKLIEYVHDFMKGGFNQYAPMQGIPVLRKAISEKMEKLYGKYFNPEKEITITAGGTQALFTAISAFVHKGDEVILFEPAYDSYLPSVLLNGGIPIPIKLDEKKFTIDWENVRSVLTSKTKMIILNTPHNPSGTVLQQNDIEELIKIVNDFDLILLSDEVYEHIIFDDEEHLSFAKYEELASRSLIVFSFGKTYHTTGWKMGYVLAPALLTNEFRKVHQFNVFCVNTPIQLAYAEMMKDEEHYLSLPKFYQQKRDYFIGLMKDSKFTLTPSKGTYFQLLEYSKLSNLSDMEFAKWLTREIGVAVIPLSPFYSNGTESKYIRICFAKSEEVLKAAAEKLSKIKPL
ncbi:MAG: methionine aminotransferase [Ignavibacteria bacterium CG22_combo_CG10-13_8_21_14_all_37_15]|nr:aminotransferase class I/II-fold pyridoxal phosphate-dependent enzyme [Ignavibacteria bacterium]NCS80982.1 aminotransferase class I/II-fold pyridoxal phosphate-dependent enzyme [Ignavibacteria bacterium]OIO14250.1 MAG: methionine aminotransferase [Ignavibacteria bacterium CG1_02_37_35]PIP77522.1 MAG: methionine aminotransferase [Ignavibacteria bacterium CG22_combo_CG10-13_8_21_14_all_37_15]PJC57557.1 MAG: methionine aminotransferase [Ignavibacteria bacterium CG_4_9_14_0_2_um_filter_37_13]